MILVALVATGCVGGTTGEIASPQCEVLLGVVSHDAAPASVGASARSLAADVARPPSVEIVWVDGRRSSAALVLMLADDLSPDVEHLGGEGCDPYLRAPVRLQVRTDDGQLNQTFEGHADLMPGSATWLVDTSLMRLPDFDASAFVDHFDPEQARLAFQVSVSTGARPEGFAWLSPGLDGADIATVAEFR